MSVAPVDPLDALLADLGSGVKAVPDGLVTVKTGEPFLVMVDISPMEAFCGDKVEVTAIASAFGFSGTVDFRMQNVSDAAELEKASAAINGRAVVTINWTTKKGKDTWDGQPDITAKAILWSPTKDELSTATSFPNLTITRPEGFEATLKIASRTAPRWVKSTPAGPWVKQASGYAFPCGFDVLIKGGVITVTTKIKLLPQGGLVVTAGMKASWKAEIEGYWNKVFEAHRKKCGRGATCDCDKHCCRYQIKIVCDFVDSREHTRVKVNPGACVGPWGSASWWYSDNWWQNKSPVVPAAVRAHEFGHNMGFYDEYKGGATAPSVDPNTYKEPTASIMNAGSSPMIWHFREFLATLAKKTADPCEVVKAKKK